VGRDPPRHQGSSELAWLHVVALSGLSGTDNEKTARPGCGPKGALPASPGAEAE
jgi:hypothetical protein